MADVRRRSNIGTRNVQLVNEFDALKAENESMRGVLEALLAERDELLSTREELLTACQTAVPALIRLGDFVGNHDSITGDRCATLLKLREAIDTAGGDQP